MVRAKTQQLLNLLFGFIAIHKEISSLLLGLFLDTPFMAGSEPYSMLKSVMDSKVECDDYYTLAL